MKRHFQYWGAVWILGALFLVSIIGQWYAMEAAGESDLFLSTVLENHQSEWLQLFIQAVLLLGLGHYVFRAEKHDIEEVKAELKEIKELLKKDDAS